MAEGDDTVQMTQKQENHVQIFSSLMLVVMEDGESDIKIYMNIYL